MKVEKLTLRRFRNVGDSSFTPDSKLNFLLGANGQGKTSYLEALSYLSTLRSFRGAKTDEVIGWGETQGEVVCILSSEGDDPWKAELRVVFATQGERASKVAFINGKPFRSSTQYLSQRFGSVELGFHTIVFNPSDHDLVRGDPAGRRAYLDRVLAAEDIEYLKILTKYQRVLEQRNSLLKSENPVSREALLDFTEPLARYGSEIVRKRLEWLQRLAKPLYNVGRQIAPRQPALKAIYASNWVPEIIDLSFHNNNLGTGHFSGQAELPSVEILEQAFWKRLSVLETAEVKARSSLVGPHRDDWMFFLGPHVLKGHGSQGEVRSALLALKLSEIELFKARTGHRPLLLLDDFSSELDQERRGFLLGHLAGTGLQVFVTSTEDAFNIGRRYRVSNGSLVEEPGIQNDHANE